MTLKPVIHFLATFDWLGAGGMVCVGSLALFRLELVLAYIAVFVRL